ncbi:MAG: hypothetical protein JSV13_08925 [Nitrospiraceae bacterium]|nr:MAG: hypothetical protein JSV13_08925 [Nitrospiraceae bacterium]
MSFFLTFFLVALFPSHTAAGTVVVKPGRFDHFTMQMPARVIAGEDFIIKVQVYDVNDNLITNFSEIGKEFTAHVDGSAVIQPSTLTARAFTGGSANITINSKKAEKVIFSLRESGGTVPIISREIDVLPNKLDHFVLQAPKTAAAGEHFDVRVIAKDLFENTVRDLDIGRNIKVNSTGSTTAVMTKGTALDFRNGTAIAHFMSEKTGEVNIEIQEIATGSLGNTGIIAIEPSALRYFKIQAPKNAVAGDEFEVLIAAYDAFDNIVTTYSHVGNGVVLTATGGSKIEPSFVQPTLFKQGQAVVTATYNKAEEIQIIAKESNRKQTGKSTDIRIANTVPDHFVVVTPDSAVAGSKFIVRIEAFDRFNNLVKNYNIEGSDVLLQSSGTGNILPSLIPPSSFISGIAMVDVIYDKAESFLISARMSPEKPRGRVAIKEVKKKKMKEKIVKKAPPLAPVKKKDVRKPAAEKTADQYLDDIKKKHTAPEKEKKKPVVSPVKVKKKSEQKIIDTQKKQIKKPVEKAEKPKTDEVIQKTKKELEKPNDVPVEKPDKPVTLAKKQVKQIEKPVEPFTVSNISIIEAKSKAMLVINITNPDGRLNYSDEIESKFGKEWLKLSMDPADFVSDKAYNFKSAFVGEVLLEKGRKEDVLNIYIELLPAGVTFDISRVRNTLIVTLANP